MSIRKKYLILLILLLWTVLVLQVLACQEPPGWQEPTPTPSGERYWPEDWEVGPPTSMQEVTYGWS